MEIGWNLHAPVHLKKKRSIDVRFLPIYTNTKFLRTHLTPVQEVQ